MEDTKFQVGAEVQIFKTELVGMVDSDSGRIIVRQPKAGIDAPGISIDEFIEEIKGVFKNMNINIKISLPDAVKKVTEGINIYLKEIFMLIETKKDPKSVDFALWVSMETSEELQKMFPVTIKSGYLKVWNTENEVIKDEMDIGILKKLGMGEEKEPAPKKLKS